MRRMGCKWSEAAGGPERRAFMWIGEPSKPRGYRFVTRPAALADRNSSFASDVAGTIGIHCGDAVATLRVLMILTRFLEDENELAGPALGRDGPARFAVDRMV